MTAHGINVRSDLPAVRAEPAEVPPAGRRGQSGPVALPAIAAHYFHTVIVQGIAQWLSTLVTHRPGAGA